MQNQAKHFTAEFQIQKHVEFGQVILIVGSHLNLGLWEVRNAFEMTWNQNDVWRASVQLDEEITYRYVIVNQKARQIIAWEDGKNRKLNVVPVSKVQDYWNLREVIFQVSYKGNEQLHLNMISGLSLSMVKIEHSEKYSGRLLMPAKEADLKHTYSYSVNGRWERGSRRILKNQDGKGIKKEENNVIFKEDFNLDFDLNYNQITDNIWVGTYIHDNNDLIYLKKLGVDAILSLQTENDYEKRGKSKKQEAYLNEICQSENLIRLNFGITDRCNEDFEKKGLAAFKALKQLREAGKKVYVHCTSGIQRSVQIVILYLVLANGLSLQDAVYLLQKKRPKSRPDVLLLKVEIIVFHYFLKHMLTNLRSLNE